MAEDEQDRLIAGIMLRVAAAAAYALMAALLKQASRAGVNPAEMLFYRSLFGLPVVLGWALTTGGLASLATRRPLAHLGRAALGTASILCTFQAIIMLALPTVITIGFTAPIFATLLSAALLGERVGPRRWTAVAIGFAGVLAVARPGMGGVGAAGLAIALVAAIGQGAVTVTLRHLGRTERPAAIVFWFFLFSLTVSGLSLPWWGQLHGRETVLLLAAGGLAGGVMQLLITASLQAAPVAVISPFDYSQIVWAMALSWALWGVLPDPHGLAGATLIAGSGLYTAWREHRLRIAAVPPVPDE